MYTKTELTHIRNHLKVISMYRNPITKEGIVYSPSGDIVWHPWMQSMLERTEHYLQRAKYYDDHEILT